MNILTKRQQKFCDEYLIGASAIQAAVRAGYSPKTARFASQWINEENLQKPTSKFHPEMRAYIDAELEKLHCEKIAEAEEVLEHLTSVLRGEAVGTEIVTEFRGDGVSVAREVQKHPSEKERLKAAELLGRRYGIFTERVHVDGAAPVVIVNDLSDADDPGAQGSAAPHAQAP